MTFSLPEIQVSPNVYAILKIVFLVAIFLVVAINVIAAQAYEFVKCPGFPNITYPEGTDCNNTINNLEEPDDEEEEEGDDEEK